MRLIWLLSRSQTRYKPASTRSIQAVNKKTGAIGIDGDSMVSQTIQHNAISVSDISVTKLTASEDGTTTDWFGWKELARSVAIQLLLGQLLVMIIRVILVQLIFTKKTPQVVNGLRL